MEEVDRYSHSASSEEQDGRASRAVALGGLVAALASTSCCIVPLVLFSLGISGAWIGNLTALAPYQPAFVVVTIGLLGYGYHLVYRKPLQCANGTCERPLPDRVVKRALWVSTFPVASALVFPYAAPLLLGT